jgi:hypothetical protein
VQHDPTLQPVRCAARATPGSEPLLCAQQARRIFGCFTYRQMHGSLRWCGCPRARIAAPGGAKARWTRDEEGDGGRGAIQQRKARSVAVCSIAAAALPSRFRALPLAVVRLDAHHEHRELDDLLHDQGAWWATTVTADERMRGRTAREPAWAQVEECGRLPGVRSDRGFIVELELP